MSYQKIQYESYGRRIVASITGVLIGIVMFAIASYVLYWNEGRTVRQSDVILEARAAAVEMYDISNADPSFEGKLVHAAGRAETKDILKDATFGVETNAIKLERNVQYYQWVEKTKTEEKEKLGGGKETITTYTYEKEWSPKPVNSDNFEDTNARTRNRNFVTAEVEDKTIYAADVTFGAYRLPEIIRNSIGNAAPVSFELPQPIKDEFEKRVGSVLEREGEAGGANARYVHTSEGTVYFGKTPSSPVIGDAKISFTEVKPADISVIAVVRGQTFDRFTASNRNQFYEVSMGNVSAEEMFSGAEAANSIIEWVLRGVGALFVIIGIRLFIGPAAILAAVIPFIGNVIGAGSTLVAFLVGIAWSLILIAFAWLRFLPLLGGGLLAIAVVLFTLSYLRGRARKAAADV
ncbi:MAG: TMEM43 family protein [Synergistaceae bacterium]|jgi:hypothetical protein|nr:TMEM43 family protein [Synergistaceae bacterium]